MLKPSAVILFLLLVSTVHAQLSPEKALQILDERYPQEKIHLFLNKEEFVAGETIWFKAYLFSGYVKSLISSTVYIELYSDEAKIVKLISVPVWDGVGQGNISLDGQLPEGVYHLRAYTKWMLNFDPLFQYTRSIKIHNVSSPKELVGAPIRWTAAAYPESGNLIAGVENKVAVRLTAMGSLPLFWNGTLVNTRQRDKPILSFKSFTSDVGAFYFTPEANNVYEVHINDGQGNASVIALTPHSEGILLQAEQSGTELYIDMIFKGVSGGGKDYKLVAQIQHQLVASSVIKKEQEVVKTSIPVGNLITGVLHLTLFDPKSIPVAERLVFIDNGIASWKDIQYSEGSDGDKKHHRLVVPTDSADHFAYSVSVEDGSFHQEMKRNIYGDLWLSDFSTTVYDHALYFTSRKEDVLSRDALMIAEKWSRFEWNKVLKNQFPVIRDSAERYLSYRGIVTRNKKAAANELITLMLRFPDSTLQFLQVSTNESGEFLLDDAVFYDTVKVFYQAGKGKRGSDVEISFERKQWVAPPPPFLPATPYRLASRNAGDSLPPVLMKVVQQLKEKKASDARYSELQGVVVSAERKTAKQKLNEELASPLFQTQNEQVFDILNDEPSIQSYSNILDWLDGRVAGLQFTVLDDSGGARIPVMRDQYVSLFLDEVQTDLTGIMTLPTSEIAMVKVIKGYFLGANSGGAGGGAIAVYTRKAGLEKRERATLPSGMMVGYSPMMKNPSDLAKTGPPENTVTRWSGYLVPDAAGKVRIVIPDPDSSLYLLTITGFTKDSTPFFATYIIGGR